MKTRAVILAGGEGARLSVLTAQRAQCAMPFAGKYRIIDFALSNCVNSRIFDVVILTQYFPHSLNDHISRGQPWDLDRSFTGGIQILQPFKGRRDTDWYSGTADAVWQNLNFVVRGQPEVVLVLSGDHIYKMNYDALIEYHEQKGADATLCTISVPLEDTDRFGIVTIDGQSRVVDFVEKPTSAPSNLANMGVYVFNTDVLVRVLTEDAADSSSSHDFGRDIFPRMLKQKKSKLFAYNYEGYWADVGVLDSYWRAHMGLLRKPPTLNLNDREWIIHTRSEERPPVAMEEGAAIEDSLLADGSLVAKGAIIERSVLSPGVYIGAGAVVRESILLTDCRIEAGAIVERCIVDKRAVVGERARLGKLQGAGDPGITVVGKDTHIPADFVVGRSVIIGTDLREADFAEWEDKSIPNGKKVNVERSRR